MYCGKASEHVLAKTKESDNDINNIKHSGFLR